MKCYELIKEYLESENLSAIPSSVKSHMTECPYCAQKIRHLHKSFQEMKLSQPFSPKKDLTDSVMEQIYKRPVYGSPVSYFRWIAAGIVIISSLFLLNFSETFLMMKSFFGATLEVPLGMVLGLGVTFYIWIFIASNLVDIKKIVRRVIDRLTY